MIQLHAKHNITILITSIDVMVKRTVATVRMSRLLAQLVHADLVPSSVGMAIARPQ